MGSESCRIRQNIAALTEAIKSACREYSREYDDIKIIAASKYADANQIKEAFCAGIINFGENRADELVEKHNQLKEKIIWHFIGHLQSRKVKLVVPVADLIHSIDSIKLLQKVDEEAGKISKIQKVLLELNLSGEETKYGFAKDEMDYFLKNFQNFKNVHISGFMTMAPLTGDGNISGNVFSGLKKIQNNFLHKYPDSAPLELSMGMSNDYKIAIREGATMVRIGSLIFL
jgi:PLP dependent protein